MIRLRWLLVAATLLFVTPSGGGAEIRLAGENGVRIWPIHYRAHDGWMRKAYLVLPRWYGPRDDPPIPLVISPHGRGVPAIDNVHVWGNLPWYGHFAVINPEGQGRKLTLYAWVIRATSVTWRTCPTRSRTRSPGYGSTTTGFTRSAGAWAARRRCPLVAHYPQLLAGAAAFDAPTNMAARYFAFSSLRFGDELQERARLEFGGTPLWDPRAYRIRSPLDWAKQIAFSGVPLQIWWSRRDRIVVNQAHESGALYRDILRLNPGAPVIEVIGNWRHTAEMHTWSKLPFALRLFGLLPPAYRSSAALTRSSSGSG